MNAGLRLHRLLVRWGLLRHPYGRPHARRHYTLTGKRQDSDGDGGDA